MVNPFLELGFELHGDLLAVKAVNFWAVVMGLTTGLVIEYPVCVGCLEVGMPIEDIVEDVLDSIQFGQHFISLGLVLLHVDLRDIADDFILDFQVLVDHFDELCAFLVEFFNCLVLVPFGLDLVVCWVIVDWG